MDPRAYGIDPLEGNSGGAMGFLPTSQEDDQVDTLPPGTFYLFALCTGIV